MQQLVATATTIFLLATILVPLIHFSERLHVNQVNIKKRIKELNIKNSLNLNTYNASRGPVVLLAAPPRRKKQGGGG